MAPGWDALSILNCYSNASCKLLVWVSVTAASGCRNHSLLQYTEGHKMGIFPYVMVSSTPFMGGLVTSLRLHPSLGQNSNGGSTVIAAEIRVRV